MAITFNLTRYYPLLQLPLYAVVKFLGWLMRRIHETRPNGPKNDLHNITEPLESSHNLISRTARNDTLYKMYGSEEPSEGMMS